MAEQRHRLQLQRRRLQNKLKRNWLACVHVLDTKLGFKHCARTAMTHGNDYGTVCLLRSLMRYMHEHHGKSRVTLVLMVLHNMDGLTDRYLQAIFTADEMRQHLSTQTVLYDVHMQREIEVQLDTVPFDHVIVVHLVAMTPLGTQRYQEYKLSQPHHRWNCTPVKYFQQRWVREMSRMVVRDD